MRSVVEAAPGDQDCILDTEASPEHLSRGTARHADGFLAVVEPWFKSLETGRRMAALARDLGIPRVAIVGNKLRDAGDRAVIEEFVSRNELELAGVVPFDERLPEAERAGAAPLDFAPDSTAVGAITTLTREWVLDGRA